MQADGLTGVVLLYKAEDLRQGLNAEAVRHIFEAKGRPQDNPLILHIPDASWLSMASMRPSMSSSICRAQVGLGRPERLPLGAATGTAAARMISRVTG
mgnify:CR=1 FL=1